MERGARHPVPCPVCFAHRPTSPASTGAGPLVTTFIIRRLPAAALRAVGHRDVAVLPVLPAARATRRTSSPAATNKNPDPQVVQNIREKYGLDKPIIVQYGKYLGRLVTLRLRHVLPRRRVGQRHHQARRRRPACASPSGPSLIETVDRHRRRRARRGAQVLVRRHRHHAARRDRRAPYPSSCSRTSSAGHRRVRAHKHDWPDVGAASRCRASGPNKWFLGVIPARRAVPVPDPAGDRAGLGVDGHRRPPDPHDDARGRQAGLHPHRPGQGPARARRSPASTRCATP